jgi:hypothetical protein
MGNTTQTQQIRQDLDDVLTKLQPVKQLDELLSSIFSNKNNDKERLSASMSFAPNIQNFTPIVNKEISPTLSPLIFLFLVVDFIKSAVAAANLASDYKLRIAEINRLRYLVLSTLERQHGLADESLDEIIQKLSRSEYDNVIKTLQFVLIKLDYSVENTSGNTKSNANTSEKNLLGVYYQMEKIKSVFEKLEAFDKPKGSKEVERWDKTKSEFDPHISKILETEEIYIKMNKHLEDLLRGFSVELQEKDDKFMQEVKAQSEILQQYYKKNISGENEEEGDTHGASKRKKNDPVVELAEQTEHIEKQLRWYDYEVRANKKSIEDYQTKLSSITKQLDENKIKLQFLTEESKKVKEEYKLMRTGNEILNEENTKLKQNKGAAAANNSNNAGLKEEQQKEIDKINKDNDSKQKALHEQINLLKNQIENLNEDLKVLKQEKASTELNLEKLIKLQDELNLLKQNKGSTEENLEKMTKLQQEGLQKLEEINLKHDKQKSLLVSENKALLDEISLLKNQKLESTSLSKETEVKAQSPMSIIDSFNPKRLEAEIEIPFDSLLKLKNGIKITANLNDIARFKDASYTVVLGQTGTGKTWLSDSISQLKVLNGNYTTQSGFYFKYVPLGGKKNKSVSIVVDTPGLQQSIEIDGQENVVFADKINEQTVFDKFIYDFGLRLAQLIILVVDRITSFEQNIIQQLANSPKQVFVVHNYQNVTTKEELQILQDHYIVKNCNAKAAEFTYNTTEKATYYKQSINGKEIHHFVLAKIGSIAGESVNEAGIKYIGNAVKTASGLRALDKNGPLSEFIEFCSSSINNYLTIEDSQDKIKCTYDDTNKMISAQPNNINWKIKLTKESVLINSGMMPTQPIEEVKIN